MTLKRPVSLTSLLLSGTLLLSGCGLLNGSENRSGGEGEPSEPDREEAQAAEFVQEGHVGSWRDYLYSRVEVTEVARLPDRTRTTIEYTNIDEKPADSLRNLNVLRPTWFRLMDTVNQRIYAVYGDIGSDVNEADHWRAGVTYELVVYSPPLPDDVDRVTVMGPGGIGEFAGVPVVDGEPESYPEEGPRTPPGKGDVVTLPVEKGPPEPLEQESAELFSTVQHVVQSRETENDRETVALRADVLFEFDESGLNGNAEKILEEVIAETRERADPEKPPITIVGHTDGVGDDAYNEELSEKRAEAVREVLEAELGSDYEYETKGMGSSDPVEPEGGDDDAWARAQNRRVEISYAFKEEIVTERDGEAEYEHELIETDPEEAGGPGAFHGRADAKPSAEAEFTEDGDEFPRTWKMRVYPFYRDGAYLVARFDVTHDGKSLRSLMNVFGSHNANFDFRVIEPETGTIYELIRIDEPDERLDRVGSDPWPAVTGRNDTQYGYFYVPAPPKDTTSMTFDGGPFGTFEDIPIVD